jgi:hypothetical protein
VPRPTPARAPWPERPAKIPARVEAGRKLEGHRGTAPAIRPVWRLVSLPFDGPGRFCTLCSDASLHNLAPSTCSEWQVRA